MAKNYTYVDHATFYTHPQPEIKKSAEEHGLKFEHPKGSSKQAAKIALHGSKKALHQYIDSHAENKAAAKEHKSYIQEHEHPYWGEKK